MAAYPHIIEVGTVTFTNGSKDFTVAGIDLLLTTTRVRPGDVFVLPGQHWIIDEITTASAGKLVDTFSGSTGTIALKILKTSPDRWVGARAAWIANEANERLLLALRFSTVYAVEEQVNDPPLAPVDGQLRLVGTVPTGAFEGHANQLALYSDGQYFFSQPNLGALASFAAGETVLKWTGSAWTDVGVGDVTGPASATDNAIARFDATTGKLLQNSGVTIDDSNNLVVPGSIQNGTGAYHRLIATATDATIRRHVSGGLTAWSTGLNRPGDSAGTTFHWASLAGGVWTTRMTLSAAGDLTSTGYVASGSGVGSARMVPGDAARSGYLAFYNAAGTRQGYIGDVAGGVISLYAEAGNAWSISGALTISGAVSALTTVASPGFIALTGAAGINGYATLKHGDATATGYLEFQHKDGTRRGYIGYASGGYINMVAEGGYGWSMVGSLGVTGTLQATSKISALGGEGNQLEIVGATKTWKVNVTNAIGELNFYNANDDRYPFTIDAGAPTHTLRVQSASVTVGAPGSVGHHILSMGAADATHRMHVSGGATGWSVGLNRPGDSAGTTLTWASYASATWTTRMSLTTSLLTLTTPLSIGTSAARVNPASGYSITNYGQGNSFWLFGANTNFISGIHFGDPADDDVGKIEYAHNGDYMAFWTNAAERMRITSGGNLLIGGTTNGGERVTITAPVGGYGYIITDNTYATNCIRFSVAYGVEMGNIGGSPMHLITNNTARISMMADGKVGFSTVNPQAVMDVNGDVAHRMASLTVANGANHNVSRPLFSSLRISAPTAAFQISGLTAGADGIEAELINTTAHQMTLNNEDASSTAGNRITTDTGGNLNCKHAILRYDATSTRWRVISYRT